jgi:WD40 repeat protein
MSSQEPAPNKKKEEKKPQIIIKLEWIFGIRKDFLPNVEFLGTDTIVYPASNNIVIYNFKRNMGSMNLQHYIQGQPHSKGITSLIAMNYSRKVVGFSEDLKDGIQISFYSITVKQGLKNFPVVQTIYDFKEDDFPKLTHTYCMTYTRSKRTSDYYIVALASDEKEYYFILWKWDLENVRDKPSVHKVNLHEAKYDEEKEHSKEMSSSVSVSMKEEDSENAINPSNNESKDEIKFKDEPIEVNINNHFELGFPSLENNLFSLTSKHSVCFYKISLDGINEDYRINLIDEKGYNDYGNEIYGANWLNDGPFCFVTDHYINIFDIKEKKLIQKLINPNGDLRIITPFTLTNSYEGFISGGKNKKFQVYAKKNIEDDNISEKDEQEKAEKYYMAFEKTKYDFVPGVNEKITDDKVLQNEKITSNERPFDFLTIITNYDTPYCIVSTSNNDLMMINIEEKEIDRSLIKYLISPFHSDSVEGMDLCINKPYLISCSKDKSVRVWDYQNKIHVISKMFEEELYSIAFHPSAMHALVSTDDKIYPLNVFYDEIDNMAPPITSKKSKEIKFSNMGHLFAFDSGTWVKIYDFLNMQIFSGPPPSGLQQKNFSITSSKINYLNWSDDDKNILASGTEYIYDWEIKEEHDTKPKIAQTNVISAVYCDKNKSIIASTDDSCLRKLIKDNQNYSIEPFSYPMRELHAFKKSKIVICSTTKINNTTENNPDNNEKNGINNRFTTCLRVFPEINKNYDFMDIPAHQGETIRVRYNFEENKIFTCGEDGCINIYSIEIPFDEPEKFLNEQNSAFTNTVLIKRGEFKIREFNKKELPAKREEKLKKIRSENNDKREGDRKLLDEKKKKIATTRYRETNTLNDMQKDLEKSELEFDRKIKEEIQNNNDEYDNQFNDNQIALSVKTRDVEGVRIKIKKQKEEHKQEKQKIAKKAKEEKEKILQEFEAKIKDLEGNKTELEGNIKSLETNQIEDSKALDWLNGQVITEITDNIDELRHKIDELKVHYTHHIKKQKEEKEKLQQTGDNLNFELKKIEEEMERQIKTKEKNFENKKKAEDDLSKITKRISDIENKIIECKKAHTYLEKCKFVLSYKIQELKKEAGPMEKVLEDLQLRTKEDELSLSKYNREFDIISQKLVNLDDLKEKTKTHEKTEHDLKNEINAFKIDLFNMLPFIDDYDKLREGFRNLRDKYLKTYVPEIQDHELESEFSNQKAKMKNRVTELKKTLDTLKQQHKENIFENRYKNNEMIRKIEALKSTIKKVKKTKETINGDQKHANAVAEIFASQTVKKLMMENISVKDKIKVFEEKIEAKKKELSYLKKNVNIDQVYAEEGVDINEESKEEENNEIGEDNYADSL